MLATLTKKQLLIIAFGFVLVTGTASAATLKAVSNNRAEEERNRVLRTANLEESGEDKKTQKEAEAEEVKKETAVATTPEKTTPANPSTNTVSFVKGGASLQGSTVVVNLTANAALNGTCFYSFTLGNSVVNKSNDVAGSNSCAINIPLSAFSKSGNWRLSLTYVSSDGKTKGIGGGFDVTVMPEVRTINFTKGGASQNDSVVVASSNLSEAQTGTCTFTFSLNGSVRVSKTAAISNSNKCSIEIPVAEFPKSAIYQYTLSFISSDTLTIANQGAFDVTVQ